MDSGNQGPLVTRIKKGELLFREGDKSRSMYLIKSGMVRLFTRRGNATIEIDTIHAGQILGELAFLDGNPRSLSGEALMECELTEISGPLFMEVINRAPDWLKILLKTVVARLRAANTRIRQLEASNGTINYDKDGSKKAYLYLSYVEFIKVASSLLLVGSRNGKKTAAGIDIDLGLIHRYAHFVMGVPLAKVASVIDLLVDINLAKTGEERGNPRTYLTNLDALETITGFMNEENLLDSSKRHDISPRGFMIMSHFAAKVPSLPKDPQGFVTLDIIAVKNSLVKEDGREIFRNDEVGELIKLGYISELKIKSQNEILTLIQPETFLKAHRCMQVVSSLKDLNEKKRQISGNSK